MIPRGGDEINAKAQRRKGAKNKRFDDPRRVVRKALRWIGIGAAFAVIGLVVGFGVLLLATPSVDGLISDDPETTAFIDRAIGSGLQVEWAPVPYEDIAIELKLAVLVSEDLRFFEHRGFDRHEIRVALKEAMTGKRLRGASTITQQLARNIWLSRERTPARKLKEAALAWKLERRLSKSRILELYLNTAIFGLQTVGAEAAAQRWFGVPAAEVSRLQAAELAATLPAPTQCYPGSGSPRAGRQVRRILERMDWPSGLRKRLEGP